MDERPKSILAKPIGRPFLLFVMVLYLLVCVVMAATQRLFIYSTSKRSPAQIDKMAQSVNVERWTNSIGAKIGFKRPSPKQPAQGSVLIMCGAAGTAIGCVNYANNIQNVASMDAFILEYPGYEDRPGTPTEKNLFVAASVAFQMLPTNQPIYLVGESLGTGVASYLAGTYTNRVGGILLISPFTSVTDVGWHRFPFLPVSLFLVDRFPSDYYLRNYRGRVAITVDGQDTVVPEKFGLRLYNGYTGPKKLWEYPEGMHCEIYLPQVKFWKEAVAFWQSK